MNRISSTPKNVAEYLERRAALAPDACAVVDEEGSCTYGQLHGLSRRIAASLHSLGASGHAVVLVMEKSRWAIAAMMGTLMCGGYYVPVDPSVPATRLESIVAVLDRPIVVVADDTKPFACPPTALVVRCQTLISNAPEDVDLAGAREDMLETQLAYVLFTSGSTGVPKGVAITHHAIATFIESFVSTFDIGPSDRIANQAPFDFDVSTKDIYGAFATGATLVLVPRRLFMQPSSLVEYLEKQHITVMTWAVAALCIITSCHALEGKSLPEVRRILFSGEVMPLKHLEAWREHAPNALLANLYGPTEITCNCLYHVVDPSRAYERGLPLGRPFDHCDVMLLDECGHRVTEPGKTGEIVVRGPSLSLGYVGMPEKTAEVFVESSLELPVAERMYRTGDMAMLSERGELYFCGRKDNQIKHMGHRIELEEIDLAIEGLFGVTRCRCAYDPKRKRVHAYYEGTVGRRELAVAARKRLPAYMCPSRIVQVDSMPVNKNGKVDRARLLEEHLQVTRG